MQRLDARRHDHVARLEPRRNDRARRIETLDLDIAQRDREVRGIDDPDGRLTLGRGQRARRNRDAFAALKLEAAGDRGAEPHRFGMIDKAEPHLECACDRISLWRHGPHARFCGDRWIVGERNGDRRVAGRGAENLGWNVEHGVAPVRPRDGEDRLSRLHNLTRLGGSRRDRALDIGPELGEADPILGNVELRGRIVDPGLRRLQRLLCRIEVRPGGEAALHQVVLAIEGVLRLDLLGLRGGQRRLRRAQRVELVLRIELRQHLIWLDLVADLALPFDNPPANAEGEVHLVFSADVACELDRIADRALFHRDRADRTGQRGLGLRLLIAASHEQGERQGADQRANTSARWRLRGAWGQNKSSHGQRARAYRAYAAGATIRNPARCALSPRMRSAAVVASTASVAAAVSTAMAAAARTMSAAVPGSVAAATGAMSAAMTRPVVAGAMSRGPVDVDVPIDMNIPIDVEVAVVPVVPAGSAAPADSTRPRVAAPVPAGASPG